MSKYHARDETKYCQRRPCLSFLPCLSAVSADESVVSCQLCQLQQTCQLFRASRSAFHQRASPVALALSTSTRFNTRARWFVQAMSIFIAALAVPLATAMAPCWPCRVVMRQPMHLPCQLRRFVWRCQPFGVSCVNCCSPCKPCRVICVS